MKVGFIGAGNVGCSLGRYLKHNRIDVAGYYSRSSSSAEKAAALTHTAQFNTISDIVTTCDTLFLTVPDGQIQTVWDEIKAFSLEGKTICHCSGALTTDIFSGIHEQGAYGLSIHPMFPFNSKEISYEKVRTAFITIEGDEAQAALWLELFLGFGNPGKIIDKESKAGYHAAAAIASNHVVALYESAMQILNGCGFTLEEGLSAIDALARSNLDNILAKGPEKALTGPVERGDVDTVRKHLKTLNEKQTDCYKACSRMLLDITARKYPDRNEEEMVRILEDTKQ